MLLNCGVGEDSFFFFFKLYIIVLVLPNIKMNPPQVYMCSGFFFFKHRNRVYLSPSFASWSEGLDVLKGKCAVMCPG